VRPPVYPTSLGQLAEPIFGSRIGAARTTLGCQVLEAYFLATVGRNTFANKLKQCNLFLYIVALAPLLELISCLGYAFGGMMDRLDTGME
jgi:hypothetical protein